MEFHLNFFFYLRNSFSKPGRYGYEFLVDSWHYPLSSTTDKDHVKNTHYIQKISHSSNGTTSCCEWRETLRITTSRVEKICGNLWRDFSLHWILFSFP